MNDSTQSSDSDMICNLEAAAARLGGDRELLGDMIDFYLEDYRTLLRRIDIAAESGDPLTLTRSAHSLKGLAANFDAMEVVDATNAVTQATRAGFGRAPQKEIDFLAHAAEKLAERLQTACEDGDLA